MKNCLRFVSFLVLCLVCLVAFGCNEKVGPTIGIVQFTTHDSLDTIRNACVKELENQGYKDGENCKIIFANCNADGNTITQTISSLKNKKCDVIVAIATPVAQEAVKYSDTIPVVFSAVSDPTDILKSGVKITGTSDAIQVSSILDFIFLMAEINNKPINKLGYIYNPQEANSVSNLAKIETYLANAGKNDMLVVKTISKSSELEITSRALCDKVDAIFVTDDNTVAEAMNVLANVGLENNKPVYTGVDSMVNDGGLATIGINYEDLGKETGAMCARILKGEKAEDIPYKVFDTNLKLFVNKKTLESLGYNLPENYQGEIKYLGE